MSSQNSEPNSRSNDRLQALLSCADIWRASAIASSSDSASQHNAIQNDAVDTGYSSLNEVLTSHGWPQQGLVELHCDVPGGGEWQLLLPILADRYITLIGPAHIPYAPALVKAGIALHQLLVINPPGSAALLWAAEQVLHCAACDVLVVWEPQHPFQYRELRKLQLVASKSRCLFFVLRSSRHAGQASPAVLRIRLKPMPDALSLEILKQRGSYHHGDRVHIPVPAVWQKLPALSQMPVSPTCHSNVDQTVSNEFAHSPHFHPPLTPLA